MTSFLRPLIEPLAFVLRVFHDLTEPLAGAFAWGLAIILLTFLVRLVLLPLAVKQTHSMRAMQRLQPEIKKVQEKYKTDRSMMRTDPEKFRQRRQKQQEAMMALYKEHGINPAAGCLPLLAQMPIFFALFELLRSDAYVPELTNASFFAVTSLSDIARAAGPGAYVLIIAMAVTTFLSQKQMMASNAGAQQPQQRVLLYAMPAMLTVFSFNFPVGVLLYWVTTNLWTMGQQYVMFRNVSHEQAAKPRSGS